MIIEFINSIFDVQSNLTVHSQKQNLYFTIINFYIVCHIN